MTWSVDLSKGFFPLSCDAFFSEEILRGLITLNKSQRGELRKRVIYRLIPATTLPGQAVLFDDVKRTRDVKLEKYECTLTFLHCFSTGYQRIISQNIVIVFTKAHWKKKHIGS